jgi:hypothetical protein
MCFIIMAILHQIFTFIKSKTMKFKLVLALLLLVISFSVSAQELTLKLSQHPNKQAVVVAVHGVRTNNSNAMNRMQSLYCSTIKLYFTKM